MKNLLILIAVLALGYGDRVHYQNQADNPCELMDVDATFVTMATQNQTEVASSTVTTMASDSSASGSCPPGSMSTLHITFNDTKAKWTLTFTLGSESEVTLNMMFQYEAKDMFPNSSLAGRVILNTNKTMTLSKQGESFKCDAEEKFDFVPMVGTNDTVYTLSLTMKNLQVQAFNVSNGTYSDAFECPQDDVTTESSSTSEETTATETTETSSTAVQTTATTSVGTTPPAIPLNTYEVKDGDETCIIMRTEIQLNVEYETKENGTKTATFGVPSVFSTEGTCGNGTDSNATLTVKFDNNTIDFFFEDVENSADIEKVSIFLELDDTRFPDAKDSSANFTVDMKLAKTADTTFYLCTVGEKVMFNNATSMDLINLQVQAFNVKNNTFNGDGTECDADHTSTTGSTTTAPVTTVTPSPSPPTSPTVNNFSVSDGGNNTCLFMKAGLTLDITYLDKTDKNRTVTVQVPKLNETTDITGTCGNTTEELIITFFDTWKIEMIIVAVDSSGNQLSADEAVTSYKLENVSIHYTMTNARFPDAKELAAKNASANGLNLFEGQVKGSYKCNAKQTINAGEVKLVTSDFRYQAFQTDGGQSFNSGNLSECEADTETNSVVPIAVGAALAGLVVIVLIAYLIGRRKSRRSGYESV